jgi:hypothetical protein
MTESVSHADPFTYHHMGTNNRASVEYICNYLSSALTPLRPINHDRLEGPQLLFPSAGVIE